jgi:hypothetical protein
LKYIVVVFLFCFTLKSQEFDRKEWGVWKTYKGCLTVREKILIDYSLKPVKMDSKKCQIISGEWRSIWENKTYTNPKQIDIDHTVPLSWAWRHGADKWIRQQKINYANNYQEKNYLLPLSAIANRTKSDKGPDEWLPETNRCAYINIFMDIVDKNRLKLSEKENIAYSKIKNKECQK